MIDEYKKFIGVLILVIAAAVSVFVMKTYYPEFYDQTIQLTLAGDIDGLGDYISSFGYGAFAVSIGLLIFCNVFSWLGEVLGIELSFHIGRIFFRQEARSFIEKRHMLEKLDKYSSVKHMILTRAIPYSPNILFTAVAVVSKLSSKEHFKATLIGKIPSVVIEVVLGHDLIYFQEHSTRFILLFLLLIGGCVSHRMYKKKHPNRDE